MTTNDHLAQLDSQLARIAGTHGAVTNAFIQDLQGITRMMREGLPTFDPNPNLPKVDNAELPECATFVGTGSRCTSCRIRKGLHA